MTYTIIRNGDYLYAYREPTQSECNRFIRNGYTPPPLVSERNPPAYQYARGETQPHYPMPAIPTEAVIGTQVVYISQPNRVPVAWAICMDGVVREYH